MGLSRLLGWTDTIVRAVAAGYLCALAGLLLWTGLPAAWGWQPTLVVGDSMGPTLRRGDLLITAPVADPAQYRPGHVVVYERAGRLAVAHRVVGREPNGDLVTRGDANIEADSTPVSPAAVRGVARLVVPSIGRPALWLREHHIVPLGLWVAVTVAAGGVAFRGRRT
jgi:signal peptidase